MKPYELRMPDGGPTNVWVCGRCQRVASGEEAIQRMKRFNETKEDSSGYQMAERCCRCHCGKVLPKNSYRLDCPACLEKHKQWVAAQPPPKPGWPLGALGAALYDKMSDVSEDHWAAGWMSGTEVSLWEAVNGGNRRWCLRDIDQRDIDQLRELATAARGWIVWEDETDDYGSGPRLIAFDSPDFQERVGTVPDWPASAPGGAR